MLWKYNTQLIIRRLTFVLTFAIAVSYALFLVYNDPSLCSQAGLKVFYTSLELGSVNVAGGARILIVLMLPVAFLIGLPTLIAFAPLMIIFGTFEALLLVILAQLIATKCVGKILSWRKFSNARDANMVRTLEKVVKRHPTIPALRLSVALPLRSVDAASHSVRKIMGVGSEPFISMLLEVSARCILSAAWWTTFLNFACNFRPYPEFDFTLFIISSSVIFFSWVLPRIPELAFWQSSLKEFLFLFFPDFFELTDDNKLN